MSEHIITLNDDHVYEDYLAFKHAHCDGEDDDTCIRSLLVCHRVESALVAKVLKAEREVERLRGIVNAYERKEREGRTPI